jgi:8-oxo-dGTP pyrophosphatase MutT (NUDIX family)
MHDCARETIALALTRRIGEWIDTRLGRNGIEPTPQAGAIPYTIVKGTPVFLLITSRGTGRWIFPKGAPIEGYEMWQVAAREAYEEAGVEGEVETAPIGSYRGLKGSLRSAPIEVRMFPLRVVRQLDEWPEKDRRHRHWVILAEARRLLSDPQLVDMASLVHRRALQSAQPAKATITA